MKGKLKKKEGRREKPINPMSETNMAKVCYLQRTESNDPTGLRVSQGVGERAIGQRRGVERVVKGEGRQGRD
jgi:hypothetical protein